MSSIFGGFPQVLGNIIVETAINMDSLLLDVENCHSYNPNN